MTAPLHIIREMFEEKAKALGLEAARKVFADICYGANKIPLYQFILQLIVVNSHASRRYFEIVRYLAEEARVPVESTDLSGTTALSWSISTKPYFEPEFADIMLKVGADINHRSTASPHHNIFFFEKEGRSVLYFFNL